MKKRFFYFFVCFWIWIWWEVYREIEKMLSIKRVPTVVSNYQKDEGDSVSGCGRNCLKSCCIQGSVLLNFDFWCFVFELCMMLYWWCFLLCFFFFLVIEAKLPLYGFKRSDKVEGEDLDLLACNESCVAFLDSIILGQVVMEFWSYVGNTNTDINM